MSSQGLEAAKSLDDVYKVYRYFPGCAYGGGVSEEIADRVGHFLARDWKNVIAYIGRSSSNEHRVMILTRYVGRVNDDEDLSEIRTHALSECPSRFQGWCKLLLDGGK